MIRKIAAPFFPVAPVARSIQDRRDPENSGFKKLTPFFNLKNTKAVIFDLDGTLYSTSEGPFANCFVRLILPHLDPSLRPVFLAEWERALKGHSPFCSGRVYDENQRKVLALDALGKVVEAFQTWGGKLSAHEVNKLYPKPVHPGDPGYDFMEGGHWVLTGLARSFDIPWEICRKIYRQIYGEISRDPGKYFHAAGLKLDSFFPRLREKGIKIIVMTNTQKDISEMILKGLGILDKIDLFVPDAKKPEKSKEELEEVLNRFHLKPCETLSVGDSVTNDLAVPHQMGMQTFLVEDFPTPFVKGSDAKGLTISSLIKAFSETWRENSRAA